MSILDKICVEGITSETVSAEIQKLSDQIRNAYNPVELDDLPFIAAVLRLQADGILRMMDDSALAVYNGFLEMFDSVSILLKKNGGGHDGV